MKKGFNNLFKKSADDKNDGVFSYMKDDEKHIENIKTLMELFSTDKKSSVIMNSIITSLQETSFSGKKQKKNSTSTLGNLFENSSNSLFDSKTDSVLAQTLKVCAEHCRESSEVIQKYEESVDKELLGPIRKYFVETIPKLNECRDHVHSSYSKLKNSRSKYENLEKQQNNSNLGSSMLENKLEALKKDLEDCEQKHQTYRDAYEVALMNFSCEEIKISELLVSYYVKTQKEYYSLMLEKLNNVSPKLSEVISKSNQRPVFGQPLSEHLAVNDRKISLVLDCCIRKLLRATNEEGLFRLSGSSSKIKIVKQAFDCGRFEDVMISHNLEYDYHLIAGVIKLYLRELPHSLLVDSLASEWLRVYHSFGHSSEKDFLVEMSSVVNKLPEENKANLCFLIKYFQELTNNHQINKMSAQNIAIAIGPSFFPSAEENHDFEVTNASPKIVETLISFCDYFFPKGKYPSLYYEEMKKEFSNETESTSTKQSDYIPNRSSDGQASGSFRSKQNTSPTKDYSPNPSPTATIHRNNHSPRFERNPRPQSYCNPVAPISPRLIPHRKAPEIKYNPNRPTSYFIIADNSECPPNQIYPDLNNEILEITNNPFPLLKSSSHQSNLQPPQKPPRSNASSTQYGQSNQHSSHESPINDTTHL